MDAQSAGYNNAGNMDAHLSEQQVQQYHARALSSTERMEVSEHVSACEECRNRLRAAKPVKAMVPSVNASVGEDLRRALREEPTHLAYDELVAYVEGTANPVEREIAEGHLETCVVCQKQARELRAFRAMLSTYPNEPLQPKSPPTPWARFLGVFHVADRSFYFQLAGASLVTAVVAFGFGVLLPRQQPHPIASNGPTASDMKAERKVQLAQASEEAPGGGEDHRLSPTPKLVAPIPTPTVLAHHQPSPSRRKIRLKPTFVASQRTSVSPDNVQNLLSSVVHSEPRIPRDLLISGGKSSFLLSGGTDTSDPAEYKINTPPVTGMAPATTVVFGVQPTLRWDAPKDSVNLPVRYKIQFSDQDFNLVPGIPSPYMVEKEKGTTWLLPGELKRGVVYLWSVTPVYQANAEVPQQWQKNEPLPGVKSKPNTVNLTSLDGPTATTKFRVADQATAEFVANRRFELVQKCLQEGALDTAQTELNLVIALRLSNPITKRAQALLNKIQAVIPSMTKIEPVTTSPKPEQDQTPQ